MKVPYSWMQEYVPEAPDAAAVAERLALVGTEVERVAQMGVPGAANGGGEGYLVGRVVSFEQHPNADRLRLCRVDVGEGEPRQIVCGAQNFAEGDTVAVVLPGATLPGGDTLGTAKLRGVESHGMMLSERELELSTDHSGIMVLPEEWAVGTPLAEHLPIGEQVLELEITPNRPDCLSVYGVAREVAAAFELDLRPLLADGDDAEATGPGSVEDVVSVELAAPELCPRYMARAFVDVTVAQSPPWLRARLAQAGMRAINNVVDVTNYVMLLVGQPLHAFDADRIAGGKIVVRRAQAGETVTTLDDVQRTLDESMLSIATEQGTAVIAGVMGAADVEVHEGTTRLVLESACFDGPTILKTAQQLGLRTESSSRFEKGLDPYTPEIALRLASKLLVEVCGATLVPGTIDAQAPQGLPTPPHVKLAATRPAEVLGIDIAADECAGILERLGCAVRLQPTTLDVDVPHWRMFDLTRSIDLVEEIARMRLDRVPATMPARGDAIGQLSRAQRLQRLVEDTCAGIGLHEAITYSLVEQGYHDRFGIPADVVVTLANPMTADHAELRAIFVGSHLDVVRRNQAAGIDDVAIFEVGHLFTRLAESQEHADLAGGATDEGGQPLFARERSAVGICVAGSLGGGRFDHPPLAADAGLAVGIVQTVARAAGIDAPELRAWNEPPIAAWVHPGQAAMLSLGGKPAGWAATLHPKLAREYGIRGDVVIAELDLAALGEHAPLVHTYRPISEFPPVRQDIALVLDADERAGDVLAAVRESAGDLLESASVFDRYEGDPIPDGKCSLALRLVFRAPDRTLTDDEVAAVRTAVVERLAHDFGADLRTG